MVQIYRAYKHTATHVSFAHSPSRKVNQIPLHNGNSKYINCIGIGTCGTCAVKIIGLVAPPNWKDRTRRSLPSHSITKNLPFACQTEIIDDIIVIKHQGLWGHQDPVSF